MNTMSETQQAVIQRFTVACEQDPRIVAAFLGGSFARGEADASSDLDIYLITSDAKYDEFFADRHTFIRHLGDAVFEEDFNQFGFDMIVFTFADDVEGELALASESNFQHTHGGPHILLVDKTGILNGKAFPLLVPTEAQQRQSLRHLITWFWEDVSNFTKAMSRKQWWLVYSALDGMRRKVVNLAQLQYDFTIEAGGYAQVEHVVFGAQREQLETTFCALEPSALLGAAFTIIEAYQQVAPFLAAQHGLEYPDRVERLLQNRLDKLSSSISVGD